MRKPGALSAARAAGFNPTVVKKWFEKYKDTIETLGLKNVPGHIWNCDETGLQDHFLSTRVVAEVGAPCFEVTGGEKGQTTTCLACINAAGGYGPTMIIFKGKRMKAEWLFGAPKNTFAWMKAATPLNGQAGFRGSGIYPFNPAKINENLFMPSQTSERCFQETPVAPDEMLFPAPATPCHPPHDDDDDDDDDDGDDDDDDVDSCQPHMWELLEQTPCHPLHDAVQPAISPPQRSPPLSPIVTPPPMAEEVEVVTQPEVSFKSLITLPVRECPTTSRQRAKPPSYSLTSDSHFAFIKEKGGKKKEKKQKPKEKNIAQVIQEACAICQHSYGDRKDPKSTEEWLSCAVCFQWFHESCAEDNGVLDDDGSLTCKDCLFPDM
ncbi:hypothetical protein JOQ06_006676 [Pogonophryne albipinna]|uniref:Zinc finger PHD-type domain-containing protein n=1 Tax=Pogonophryne albipinna TaxID=1090488 RepID=A0AAD6AZE0_9TELE|nr:hypothetical protein JOQ06_006676 [Pogonophryne albipinna]